MKIETKFINHAKSGLQLGLALSFPLKVRSLINTHKTMFLKVHLLFVTWTVTLNYDYYHYTCQL